MEEKKGEVKTSLAGENGHTQRFLEDELDGSSASFRGIDEAALVRKIDLRLLPVLFIVYLAAFLDRVNISNALTMGLPKDLHLTKDQPNIALTMFFIPYVLFEIPSNIAMKKLTPHVWLSACTCVFGIAMLGQGFVKNFSGILGTRFILGLAEAGIFPGSFYLISFWYKREESQKRFTFFWCSVLIAGAFGGLLASAIANMNGVAGYKNWRWIFILEGIATIVIGVCSFFFITDFPDQAKWLTEEEREFVRHRTGHDKTPHRPIDMKDIGWFFTDLKRILGAFMYWGIVVPIYAYSYFAPTIIKTLGYSVVQTQLRSVIPFAAALVGCIIVAYLSDKIGMRFPFVAFGLALAIVGLGILMNVHHHFSVQFGALCLVAMGAFIAGIAIVCWYVMNLHGHLERSIGTAWMISFGNTGGILATFTFLAADAPYYKKGYSICMGSICLSAASTACYALLILRERRSSRAVAGVSYSL
ncbi:MFS general substrate transporter [Lindgomyces ingoldianus]|uniref:MFS general substrate transporter n=1 Tax=Lindgomyces ingoldianus TaxID=673940 RepID=A0ACB6Q873_9PLEO|nr:MFS general substrate transporter [Lindgomyces ingoldianus]KAF2463074.1 MFS general substrate transporter [Lindgomyces ingoldianus]